MGEFSLPHILLVLVIVLVFFGPSRLPGLGKSLGEAIRGFKQGITPEDNNNQAHNQQQQQNLQAPQQNQAHLNQAPANQQVHAEQDPSKADPTRRS